MNDQTVLEPESEIVPRQRSSGPQKGARYLALAIVILLIVAAVVGFFSRFGERRALAKETEQLAVPSVVVIQPKTEPPQQELVLPSTLQAFTESPIYARTNEYLAHWYKDIDSKVIKRVALVDKETPEVD